MKQALKLSLTPVVIPDTSKPNSNTRAFPGANHAQTTRIQYQNRHRIPPVGTFRNLSPDDMEKQSFHFDTNRTQNSMVSNEYLQQNGLKGLPAAATNVGGTRSSAVSNTGLSTNKGGHTDSRSKSPIQRPFVTPYMEDQMISVGEIDNPPVPDVQTTVTLQRVMVNA